MVLVWIILAEGVGYHLHIIFQGFFRHMYRYFVSEDSEKGEMKKGGQKCYDRDNRLRSKTLSIVREVGSGLYLNKQNASDEVLSVLE